MEGRRNTSGLDVLLEVWSRRKWLAILVFTGPFAVTVSLAVALPNLYRSTATFFRHERVGDAAAHNQPGDLEPIAAPGAYHPIRPVSGISQTGDPGRGC